MMKYRYHSRRSKSPISTAPIIKANIFHHLFPGNENSSMINSLQATYKKVPPAIDVNIIEIISGVELNRIPSVVPSGVANEKIMTNLMIYLNSILLLVIEIVIDIDSANLWINIDKVRLMTEAKSFIRPRAMPSKIEWTDKAIIRINGVRLHFYLSFLLAFV